MFGIMNSIIRVATRSDAPSQPYQPMIHPADWRDRDAIERSSRLRTERRDPLLTAITRT
ncbi:hypothetical protein [Pararhodobacter zhoushanensis]|uniref:hypothetical protein n=1 Tax=Pararhodobacter zhoushanensis TaxID=2479545 RepID=UPI0013DF806D|nr:hypothetical protein [Pararhodobacter zhoushanensis]